MKILKRFNKQAILVSGCLLAAALCAHARNHGHWMIGDTLYLDGYSGATIQAIAEGRMLWDGTFYCEAWLTFTGDNSFELITAEHMPTPIGEVVRVREAVGEITNGGIVTIEDQELLENLVPHVGVTAHGRGIQNGVATYMGYFDGQVLSYSAHVIGLQTQPAEYPFYWKNPDDPNVLFKGPIDLVFFANLTVVE